VACQTVCTCTSCPQNFSVPTFGINPRGLLPGHLWQMDVTHFPEFGQLQFVHVIIDTFSHFFVATAWTGEAVKDVVAHCLHAFSILGILKCIKANNAPAYTSKSFFTFCWHFGINIQTGIPYNLQGEGIVECAHCTLKAQLLKWKGGILNNI
jgi:transposase InsO family protein